MASVDFSIYQGKKSIYGLIKINEEKFDVDVAPTIKKEFIDYFESNNVKENCCIDLRNVRYTDSTGLSAILVFRRLSVNRGYSSPILLMKEDGSVEELFKRAQIDSMFNIVHSRDEL